MSEQPPVPVEEAIERIERLKRLAYTNRRFWADAAFRAHIWGRIERLLDWAEAELERAATESTDDE